MKQQIVISAEGIAEAVIEALATRGMIVPRHVTPPETNKKMAVMRTPIGNDCWVKIVCQGAMTAQGIENLIEYLRLVRGVLPSDAKEEVEEEARWIEVNTEIAE